MQKNKTSHDCRFIFSMIFKNVMINKLIDTDFQYIDKKQYETFFAPISIQKQLI